MYHLCNVNCPQRNVATSSGCSSKMCNEAVREDMGLESVKERRDRSKLKWWNKVNKLITIIKLSRDVRFGASRHIM